MSEVVFLSAEGARLANALCEALVRAGLRGQGDVFQEVCEAVQGLDVVIAEMRVQIAGLEQGAKRGGAGDDRR